jgi:hypothetical protein
MMMMMFHWSEIQSVERLIEAKNALQICEAPEGKRSQALAGSFIFYKKNAKV